MTPDQQQANTPREQTPQKTFHFGAGSFVAIAVIVLTLAVLIHAGIASRAASEASLIRETRQTAVQDVSVIHPKLSAPTEEIVLPGNMQAFTDAPIYSRTNGYLKHWYADIGARVHKGDLLADIDTPELDQQLQQARADLETAQANYKLAQTTAARWQFLLKSQSVSQQETDEKVGDLNAKKAMVDSAISNVRRLENLQSYEKVYAPFDGVVTARNVDVGALINAGADATPGSGKELFHLAAINRLRVFVSVPEVYQRAARAGTRADLTLNEFPDRSFAGQVARNSSAIDPASRTLLVEVDVNNPGGELLPGAYVSVRLKLASRVSAVTIPVNTMLFRSEGLRVALVRDGRAQLTPIVVGRDFGNTVEVASGVKPGDQLIVNPSDSLVSGARVRVTGQAE